VTSGSALATALRAEAGRLGLHRIGFARPDLGAPAGRLAEWLARGHAGEMSYISRRAADRADPGRLIPRFRSAIVATQAYADAPAREVFAGLDRPGTAYFARYARGSDYHEVLRDRLEALADLAGRLAPGCHTRVYVDTGPVLEKDLGLQAGLGWRGKHTNLIAPDGGNWLFLGVVLTDLDLPPDAPVPDRCGTCTRCLDVCPTDAFPAPYVLDARRCISYLTIELKGPIPPRMRPALGNRVFGCDDCLAVCPWNRFAARAREAAYAGRAVTAGAPLADLLAMTPDDFAHAFRHTAVWRTGRARLARNAAVALGNSCAPDAVPDLARALVGGDADPEPLVRGHAAWALGRIATGEARAALRRAQGSEADPSVGGEIAAAMRETGSEGAAAG
jgi:epoxyqueuosine reductase